WYRFIYAPRTGGAYDSHHWTAGIAGRTRRRGGRVAAGGARAAAAAGARLFEQRFARVRYVPTDGPSAGAGRNWRRWGAKFTGRIPLGGKPVYSTTRTGG